MSGCWYQETKEHIHVIILSNMYSCFLSRITTACLNLLFNWEMYAPQLILLCYKGKLKQQKHLEVNWMINLKFVLLLVYLDLKLLNNTDLYYHYIMFHVLAIAKANWLMSTLISWFLRSKTHSEVKYSMSKTYFVWLINYFVAFLIVFCDCQYILWVILEQV